MTNEVQLDGIGLTQMIRPVPPFDTSIAPTDGQALVWDATASKYRPGVVGGVGYAIIDSGLSSVSGSIDATAAFTAAFATGKPVLVPPGTYTVTSWAPPTRTQVIGCGQDNTTIRYAGTGTMCTLTGLQRNKFVDLRFLLTNSAGTLFKVDNTFRASWTRCVFQGQHTAVADAYATTSGHVGAWLTGNAGDNLFYDCDFLNLGVGIKTDCIQNGVVGGKFGSNYVGIYGFNGGGMSVSGYVDFVGPAPTPIVSKAVHIDGATGQWWFDQCWFEGAVTALSVGNGSAGPAQFAMSNCKVAATTTCIDMLYCRNPILTNISFTGDQSNTDTPDPIVVNSTNAPQGILWGDSIVTGKAITPANLPKGWMVHTRTGSTGVLKVGDEVQFPYQSKLRMARSDGTYADILIIQGGPQMALRGPGTGVGAVIHVIDTTNNTLLDIDSVSSAVNFLGIVPAVTGSGPALAARGTDTNVDLALTAKGTGQVRNTNGLLYLANAGAAPSTPTGGGVLYGESGLLKHKASTGAVATLTPVPVPVAAQYFYPASPSGVSTSATLGNGTLRLYPWLVETAITIDRLGADVSVTGDAGSKVRLGVYADTGAAYPGTLLVDAGQIAGDSATVQQLTVALTLTPGLYWLGAVIQSVTTTQPTLRIVSNWTPPVLLGVGTSLPAGGGTTLGFSQSGVTGALPGTFTSTVSAAGSAPRLLARAA